MRYYIARNGAPQTKQILDHISDLGFLLSPCGWQEPYLPYACDNGVYAAYLHGMEWEEETQTAWLGMLNRLPEDFPPDWILLPDAVADWPRTVELATLYGPVVRQRNLPIAIALQDGCDFEEVLPLEPQTVFVAGSTQWKEANIHHACDFFKPRGIGVHVGRVNTIRRLRLCQSAGANSVDGTTLNKFQDINLPRIANALKQECLLL